MITGVFEARHLIGGRWSDEGDRFESRATTDGEVLCRAPVADGRFDDRRRHVSCARIAKAMASLASTSIP